MKDIDKELQVILGPLDPDDDRNAMYTPSSEQVLVPLPDGGIAVKDDRILGGQNLSSIIQTGIILARSGFFQDARDEAQAVAKVLAGAELGVAPIAAMTGIFLVKGRVTLSANILAALIVRSGKYKYRIKEHTDSKCVILFTEGDEQLGYSAFTIDDAKRAGLVKSGSGWANYPKAMLFARALSQGARWYCPDIGVFAVYTPEEMGGDVSLPPAASLPQVKVLDEEAFAKLQNANPVDPFGE